MTLGAYGECVQPVRPAVESKAHPQIESYEIQLVGADPPENAWHVPPTAAVPSVQSTWSAACPVQPTKKNPKSTNLRFKPSVEQTRSSS
jgi:hypothetical protein